MNKGQVWISAVLYILIATVALVLILQAGLPALNSFRDRSSVERSTTQLNQIDAEIIEIASEGQGSQRVIPIQVQEGDLVIEDSIKWQIETQSKVIEPRTKKQVGNVEIYSNIDVSTSEETCGSYNCFVLENSLIKVKIPQVTKKTGFNTNELINEIQFKETGDTTTGFTFSINGLGNVGTATTSITTPLNQSALDRSAVIIDMQTPEYNYTLKLTLESQSDFIQSELLEVE